MLAAVLMVLLPTLAVAQSPVQISVTTWLIFDPAVENRLTVDVPADLGGPTGTELVGGVLATLHVDPVQLLLNVPLSVDVEVDEIRVAGASFAVLPSLPTLQTGTERR